MGELRSVLGLLLLLIGCGNGEGGGGKGSYDVLIRGGVISDNDPNTNGMPVWQEYIAGLDPLNPNSKFSVEIISAPPAAFRFLNQLRKVSRATPLAQPRLLCFWGLSISVAAVSRSSGVSRLRLGHFVNSDTDSSMGSI